MIFSKYKFPWNPLQSKMFFKSMFLKVLHIKFIDIWEKFINDVHVYVNIVKHIKKKQKQTSGLTKWRWNLIYQWSDTQSTSYILQLISNQINYPLINKKIKLTGMVDRVCPKTTFLYHFTRILINRTKFHIINNILIEDINTFSHQFK